MTEANEKSQAKNLVAIGIVIALVAAGGAFAVLHRHAHASTSDKITASRTGAATRASATLGPATTRGTAVKHKKKKH